MQTSYQGDYPKFANGLITRGGVTEVITLIPEEDMGFGVAVTRGTGASSALMATAGDTVVGVTALVHNEDGQYLIANDPDAKVLTKGSIAVRVATGSTIAEGEAAYMIPTAGATQWQWTNIATDNVACGVFQSLVGADSVGNLALVKLDIVA